VNLAEKIEHLANDTSRTVLRDLYAAQVALIDGVGTIRQVQAAQARALAQHEPLMNARAFVEELRSGR
jgi:hypothetical protein